MTKQPTSDVWGANGFDAIIKRNVEWAVPFVESAVMALRRDGRPLGTEAISQPDRLAALLEAGPEFWDALKSNPQAAAKLAADVLQARAKGKIPAQGPRVGEAQWIEDQQNQEIKGAPQPFSPGATTGVERDIPLPWPSQGAAQGAPNSTAV